MNVTNSTEYLEDYVSSTLEETVSESSEEVGLIESSLLKIIPKFFRAMATLIICGLLLGVTFLLITLWKRGCRTHRKLEEEKATNGSATHHLHSVVVTPPTDDDEGDNYPPRFSSNSSAIPSSSLQPINTKSKYMKVPKQQYLRRASGPFGSEALSFAVEQYTMKHLEKEAHLHHGHHHHHSKDNIRSGASAGGGSVKEESGTADGAKSKWNCFKKTPDNQ